MDHVTSCDYCDTHQLKMFSCSIVVEQIKNIPTRSGSHEVSVQTTMGPKEREINMKIRYLKIRNQKNLWKLIYCIENN